MPRDTVCIAAKLTPPMSALGQKRTSEQVRAVSALPPKADILTQRITDPKTGIAAGYSKQRGKVLRECSLSSNRVEVKSSSEESSPSSFWELVMSCYSHCQRGATFAAPRTFSLRAVLSRVADRLRRARDRRRQRQELIDYLRSDHRAARDLGITIYEVDHLCR